MTKHTETDNLHSLLAALPEPVHDALQGVAQDTLLEIVMDLGRRPQARFPGHATDLSDQPVTRADIDQVVAAIGEFSGDNRAGIEGTLHRVSAIRNRRGEVVGLTLRVGRAVFGTIESIRDLVESGKSVLLLGKPGVGKTTKLREVARVLADELEKRVIVIDTSNEIAGDGDIPHPGIGSARRMQVTHPQRQHAVMIEAVENHMPEVIIVDEIGTEAEALAARTIAERGVQLIGTAHGTTLENLVSNPTLADLVGGVQTVTLGDEEARLRRSQKTVIERKGPPTFDAVVEIVDRDTVTVHPDTARAVDNLLRGLDPGGLRRTPQGETEIPPERPSTPVPAPRGPRDTSKGPTQIYPYAVSRDSVDRVIRELGVPAATSKHPERADLVIALRSRARDPRLRRILDATHMPLHVVKKNSTAQIRKLLEGVFNVVKGIEDADVNDAVREAEHAVQRVMDEGIAVSLSPRSARLRRLQHRITSRHHLVAESEGSEPQRHLVIYPG